MLRKSIYICLTVLVFLIVFFEAVIINIQSVQIKKMEINISWSNHLVSLLKSDMINTWKFDRLAVNNDSIFDEEENKVDTEYFKSSSPILLFRFSKVNCMDCVVKQIDVIKELIKNESINYMMICDYDSKRDLGHFKRSNAIKNPVYNCKNLLENESKTPFFGICRNGVISDVFFPNQDFPDLTAIYLQEMKSKYFSN